MGETPRTDEHIRRKKENGHVAIVSRDFARQLETELAAAIAELRELEEKKMNNKQLNLIMGGGKSNSGPREENDFYATNPQAIYNARNMFKEIELYRNVWECACGAGNISKSLLSLGYDVRSSDKIDRGYGWKTNFLTYDKVNMDCDIVTNPPFKYAEAFIRKSMEVLKEGRKACFFLKIQFLESKTRKILFGECPPKYVYVYSERQGTAKNNQPEIYGWGGTWCYCWIVFEKGYKGETILRWI